MYAFLKEFLQENLGNNTYFSERRFGMEELVQIVGFPMYSVSASGAIVNMNSGRNVATSLTKQGHVKVNLYDPVQGKQYTRSVSLIVAHAFVYGHNDIFNTPQHLNGVIEDCSAENLVWRPRWYAYNYHRQWTHEYDNTFNRYAGIGPLLELTTDTMYQTLYDAIVNTGVLVVDLIRTLHLPDHPPVRPLHYRFENLTRRMNEA
jgi:hypothetical protein